MRLEHHRLAYVMAAVLVAAPVHGAAAQSVTCIIESACPSSTCEGGSVAVHLRCSVSAHVLGSLDLLAPVFKSRSTNTYGNDALSPDTILAGLISFGAAPTPRI